MSTSERGTVSNPEYPSTSAHFQLRTTSNFLPVELDGSGGEEKFWVICMETAWHENGVSWRLYEMRVRCRDCNWGYNSGHQGVTVHNLLRIGEETSLHVKACQLTMRTIPLEDGEYEA